MPPLLDAYIDRYLPWARELSGARDAAPERAEIAREHRRRPGTISAALYDGLTLYAEIAGWLKRAA